MARFEPASENRRDFTAPYTYHEYPKWVKLADGTNLLVNDEQEEFAATSREESVKEVDERETLLAEAKALGLTPHHRLGVDALRKLIDKEES